MVVVRACFMVKIRVILYCGIFLASTVRDYWDIGYAAINLVSIICGTVSKFTTINMPGQNLEFPKRSSLFCR